MSYEAQKRGAKTPPPHSPRSFSNMALARKTPPLPRVGVFASHVYILGLGVTLAIA